MRTFPTIRFAFPVAALLAGASLAMLVGAAETSGAGGSIVTYTATTENVSGAPDAIRITVLRWSTDAERDSFLSAWEMKPASVGEHRGGAQAQGNTDPFGSFGRASQSAGPPRAGAGAPPRRGGASAGPATPPRTPESSLAAALEKAPTVGYLWSSEVAGYALRYARKLPEADGGERIIFLTGRRLGAFNDRWKPAAASVGGPGYDFSLIELHVNSKGEGVGKASLTGKIALDKVAGTLALEDYGALPVVLKNVRVGK